jgi:hypothetical protein
MTYEGTYCPICDTFYRGSRFFHLLNHYGELKDELNSTKAILEWREVNLNKEKTNEGEK